MISGQKKENAKFIERILSFTLTLRDSAFMVCIKSFEKRFFFNFQFY